MPVSKGGGSGPLCIVSHPLELCSERRNLRIRPNKSDSDFISNRNSEWSTRTFNLDLKFGADDDLGELLDQLILKKHQNAPGRQGRGHPGSLFDEYELESALPSNSDYLKCDLACLGFRLQETGFKAHAEFLIYMKFGDVIVSSWKRFNDFKNLANTIDLRDFPYVRNNPTLYIYATLACNVSWSVSHVTPHPAFRFSLHTVEFCHR